jgi:hypothetical protein
LRKAEDLGLWHSAFKYISEDGKIYIQRGLVGLQKEPEFARGDVTDVLYVPYRLFTWSVMERLPHSSTAKEVGSSDVITRSRTFGTSVFLPAESDGAEEQGKGVDGVVLTLEDMGSTSSTRSVATRLPPSATATPVAENFTEFTVWTEEFWNSSGTPTLSLLVTTQINIANDTNVSVASDLIPEEGDASCVEWEAAQHNLFQTANLFFAAAFIVPRSFKQSLLLLR